MCHYVMDERLEMLVGVLWTPRILAWNSPSITAVDLNTHATEERLVTFEEPQPGDEVVLRTGGPVMTVLGSDDDRPRELCCAWFDEQRHRCQGTFHPDLLVIVEPVV